jgi:NAD(P)-dependent dehydrogenase (short-subunit alcohol dehydrogenase family)
MIYKIALFGATGGLGSKLFEKLKLKDNYEIISVGSKDVDITDYNQVKLFFENNDIDIVINLAGINYDKFLHKITENDLDSIKKSIDVNIIGAINIISCCLQKMRLKNYGRIILTSSVLAEKPVVATSIYSGCKGFIDSFTKTIALENANKNISCNTIQLGYFDGGLTYKINESIRDNIKNTIPMNRWGSIDELNNLIELLINTPYITGTNIKINGGIDF